MARETGGQVVAAVKEAAAAAERDAVETGMAVAAEVVGEWGMAAAEEAIVGEGWGDQALCPLHLAA